MKKYTLELDQEKVPALVLGLLEILDTEWIHDYGADCYDQLQKVWSQLGGQVSSPPAAVRIKIGAPCPDCGSPVTTTGHWECQVIPVP